MKGSKNKGYRCYNDGGLVTRSESTDVARAERAASDAVDAARGKGSFERERAMNAMDRADVAKRRAGVK